MLYDSIQNRTSDDVIYRPLVMIRRQFARWERCGVGRQPLTLPVEWPAATATQAEAVKTLESAGYRVQVYRS